MIELHIPGRGAVQIEHLVCDVNGTLAIDGRLIEGLARTIKFLRDRLTLHLLTADTHGGQDLIDSQLGLRAVRLQAGPAALSEALQKARYVEQLGAAQVMAIGQGANDAAMLQAAAIGICVISPEGTAIATLMAADVVVPNIQTAFELIEKPLRLVATLRT